MPNFADEQNIHWLSHALIDARRYALSRVEDLAPEQWRVPTLEEVNPIGWEIGHIAWFQERWCLRNQIAPLAPSILEGADAMFDSSNVPHSVRWNLPLPSRDVLWGYLDDVLELVLKRLEQSPPNAPELYFFALALFHEDMHGEALTYTRQTLGYAAPPSLGEEIGEPGTPESQTDVSCEGGEFFLGAMPGAGWVHDNEKWAHRVRVAPFAISRFPVTETEFLEFMADGGYRRMDLWTPAGWQWRMQSGAENPRYWAVRDGEWMVRRYDEFSPPRPDFPVIHVNCHEAEAFCVWAGRRLPTEIEWEYAATASCSGTAASTGHEAGKNRFPWGPDVDPSRANVDGLRSSPVSVHAFGNGDSPAGLRQMIGNVWEWTASSFEPYPGFVADPYADYSRPWFGAHRVLRGGSFATRLRGLRATWRNFFLPHRNDVFCGFRTCKAEQGGQ